MSMGAMQLGLHQEQCHPPATVVVEAASCKMGRLPNQEAVWQASSLVDRVENSKQQRCASAICVLGARWLLLTGAAG
jgi:hypothetical protein